MTTLQEMHQRTCFRLEFDRMIQTLQPICNCFGINSFYYSRIVSIGKLEYFASIGSFLPWQEFFLDNIHEKPFCPSMKQIETVKTEYIFFKNISDPLFENTLESIWDKFHTNVVLHRIKKFTHGVEQFGFGLKSNHPKAERNLLNGLPLVSKFIDFFYEENQKLIQLMWENQVEISTLLGSAFYQFPEIGPISKEKKALLKQLGLEGALSLTDREKEILKFLTHGYPSSYIAKELHLSVRTVEHHIGHIKQKLYCESKIDLIKVAHAINVII